MVCVFTITKGLVKDLPDAIELNIEHLKIGMFIYIQDLNIDGCQFIAPGNSVIVGVKTARTVVEEVVLDEEEDAETESDTKKPDENAESDSENKDKADNKEEA